MTSISAASALPSEQRDRLSGLTGARVRNLPALLLLLDTIAAIGFAAGLAIAIGNIASGQGLIVPWAVFAALCAAARGLLAMLSLRTGAIEAGRVKIALRRRVVDGLVHAPPGRGSTGTFINAAVDEVEALDGYVARYLPARRAAAIAPMIVLLAIAWASPVAAAILGATLLPFIAAMILAGGAAATESRRQFTALTRLSGLFADRVRALPIVLAFGAQVTETGHIAEVASDVADRTIRVLRVAFISSAALEFFAALSVALVAVYAGFNLLGLLPFPVPEKLTLVRAFFILALAPEFYAPMRRLAAAYHDRQGAESAADRLDTLVRDQAGRHEMPLPSVVTPPRLDFDRIAIRYPDTDCAAIEDFSLSIAPGEVVALMGRSGVGKTSVLRLLLGLAPLSGGRVLLNGSPLPPNTSLAGLASWAGQDPLLLPGTIFENLALAWPHADAVAVHHVAAEVGLTAMLGRRAGGLAAVIDSRGSGLSGGERRRIGMARAMLKPAPLLLLDEPTAHLDDRAEADLVETIRAACRGRTVIIATHSAMLAAIADRVIRLDRA